MSRSVEVEAQLATAAAQDAIRLATYALKGPLAIYWYLESARRFREAAMHMDLAVEHERKRLRPAADLEAV